MLASTTQLQDELFDRLSHPVRRRILRDLAAADRGTVLSSDDFIGDRSQSKPARIELYHTHLPRLAAVGYIEWNRQADIITHGPEFESIAPFLDLLTDHSGLLPGK
ncbi:DUF7344 domain-containing protein [Haloarcula nitratireducens]|uniref:DUF7344 domain-containing protein n=1 Tax=Haloarcula nitratireducens TaxID=2487749 RepID=UPI003CCBF065